MKNIMSIIFRLIVSALALSLCLAMVSCSDPNGSDPEKDSDTLPETDTPTLDTDGTGATEPAETDPPTPTLDLVKDGVSNFTVIYPDGADQLHNTLAARIQKAVEQVSGVKIFFRSDLVPSGSNSAQTPEILLGLTNREESVSASAELTEEDQYIVRITGKKIILIGNSAIALQSAVESFLSEYVGWNSESDFTASAELVLTEGEIKGVWTPPTDIEHNGFYGLTQEEVDEKFSAVLDGIFTGKTTETIVHTDVGGSFFFHFPDIIYVNGEYWGYYICYATNTGKGGVGLATSKDGVNWENRGCVIQPDQDYDCNGAYFAGVWLDDDGTFYCTYECRGGENTEYGTLENIALATSKDGVNWEKHGVILYADRDGCWWQKANVGTPDLYKVDGVWYLTFHGYDFVDCRVGIAYGEDLFNLTVLETPILNTEDDTLWSGTIGRRDVIYCDGYYYMVYEVSTDQVASGGYGGAQWNHMFARSRDLIVWETVDAPLILSPGTGFGFDGPCWGVIDGKLHVYMRIGAGTMALELKLAE